jgi:hypothetical protein
MICGWQTAYGMPYDAFCAERKGDGLPMCAEHFEQAIAEYSVIEVPENVALGHAKWALRLLWEGEDPNVPMEASAGEIARYAAILTPERGE